MKFSLALLAVVPTAFAHFILQYPNSLGFDDDVEGQSPCGGFSVPSPLAASANSTNAAVGSFAVSLRTTHPQASWLYRATVSAQAPYNWTNLLPVVTQTSIGQFCLPNLKAPSDFAGQVGLIQIIQAGDDGYLYQCAVVNFIAGSNTTVGATCTNATGLTATTTGQSNFTSSNASTTSTATSATASATKGAANTIVLQNSGYLGAAFMVIGAVLMV